MLNQHFKKFGLIKDQTNQTVKQIGIQGTKPSLGHQQMVQTQKDSHDNKQPSESSPQKNNLSLNQNQLSDPNLQEDQIDGTQTCKENLSTQQQICGLIQIEAQNVTKNKTDDNIPNQTTKLIEARDNQKASQVIDKGGQDTLEHSVQQKYDLVSKNNHEEEQFEIDKKLLNYNIQQINIPEHDDSDMVDKMSLRSSQTQNIQNNNFITNQNQQASQTNFRRTNSQENILTLNRFLQQKSSQSGFSISGHNTNPNSQVDMASNKFAPNSASSSILQNKLFKGIKLSKLRIIEKTTVYVIGLSPTLADKSIMSNYEYFGQYGQIKKLMVRNRDTQLDQTSSNCAKQHQTQNKQVYDAVDNIPTILRFQNCENLATPSTNQLCDQQSVVCSESASSSKSQLSFAAHITFSTPEDASLAILALDKFVFDGRKIRASYGRTKFCKYFLQHAVCPDKKSCPYLHKDCKEEEILTPEDMNRKEELFSQCQKLAIQVSKIAQMTESQYRNLLQHKRELLCHRNNHKHILPKVESIFENKDLIKNINLCRKANLKAKRINQLKINDQQTHSIQKLNYQTQISNIQQFDLLSKTADQIGKERAKFTNPLVFSQNNSYSTQLNNQASNHKQTAKQADVVVSEFLSHSVVCENDSQTLDQRQYKLTRSGSHRQLRDQSQNINKFQQNQNKQVQLQNSNTKIHENKQTKLGLSKSQRRNSQSKIQKFTKNCQSQQFINIQLKDVKIQKHQSEIPNNFKFQRQNVSPKMQDLIKTNLLHSDSQQANQKLLDQINIQDFVQKQEKNVLKKGLNQLMSNVKKEPIIKNTDLNALDEQSLPYSSVFSDHAQFIDYSSQNNQRKTNANNQSIQNEINKSKNTLSGAQQSKDEQEGCKIGQNKQKSQVRQRRRLDTRDRQKSVSKSIQRSLRQNSMSSHVEYTLKYVLNDDMAICNTNQKYKQEPLIENHNEESEIDRNSLINQMIHQNQMLYNEVSKQSVGAIEKDQFDVKSSFQSTLEGRMGTLQQVNQAFTEVNIVQTNSNQTISESNLQTMSNLYTSPFFLVNTQCRDKIDYRESQSYQDNLVCPSLSQQSSNYYQHSIHKHNYIKQEIHQNDVTPDQSNYKLQQNNNDPSLINSKLFKANYESQSVKNQNMEANRCKKVGNQLQGDFGSVNMADTKNKQQQKQNMANISQRDLQNKNSKIQGTSCQISSAATESQTKTYQSVNVQPFHVKNTSKAVKQQNFNNGNSICKQQVVQNRQYFAKTLSFVNTDSQLHPHNNHQKNDKCKLNSEGQQTPGKCSQYHNKTKLQRTKMDQTDDIIDQCQHWNQIFLQDDFEKPQIQCRRSFNKDDIQKLSGSKNGSFMNLVDFQHNSIKPNVPQTSNNSKAPEQKMMKQSNIITSRSVFSFPILDDQCIDMETPESSLLKSNNRKGRSKNENGQDKIKNDRRRSLESANRRQFQCCSLHLASSQKRKSLCDAGISFSSHRFINQTNKQDTNSLNNQDQQNHTKDLVSQ